MKKSLTGREFLRSTAVFSSAAVCAYELSIGAEAVSPGRGERPNIIFLMSDQQRWDCIGRINPMLKTPAMDRIADIRPRRDARGNASTDSISTACSNPA
jgi:hypothetical protein